ncbi:uncharacterized protein LOC126760723 [Bactrocera neohumeralis]|uniref:uncharacterized protein LOC126760723 n=1 Tax=Bactrocera neohumeralis TaxID=98809 RepID=UPI001A99E465|nr:uncharacterized protein LOC120775021 isoform X1 [Bactrocera tryoni]XP_050332533.1 uncharacterized protein LOC126760723 [Bactrocera neohumeralis]
MCEIANGTRSTRFEWSLMRVGTELRTHEQGVRFAEENGLIPSEQMCPVHKVPKTIRKGGKFGYFVCYRGTCTKKPRVSVTIGTWFENVRISVPQVYFLMYCFACRMSREEILREDYTNDGKTLSSATITDWYSYCREAVVIYQLDHQYEQGKIGGPGKIVQIDESKFGRRKYNKGRHVEGHWVLGMIEDGSEDIRLEVCPDNLETADNLIPLIQKHVAEGSIVRTDGWRAYDALTNFGYVHQKVNHSDETNPFVSEDGVHTQRIASQWRVVKRFFYKADYNHTANFADIIVEYMWRRSIQKQEKDPFVSLIDAIKYVYTLH